MATCVKMVRTFVDSFLIKCILLRLSWLFGLFFFVLTWRSYSSKIIYCLRGGCFNLLGWSTAVAQAVFLSVLRGNFTVEIGAIRYSQMKWNVFYLENAYRYGFYF